MKNKKGFTLIELLAVLLILAIIALIVTPIISKIIGSAKESADRRSVERYVRAAQTFYMESQVDENKKNLLGTNILDNLDLEDIEATGSIVAYPDGNVEMAIIYNGKCYTKTSTQSVKNIEVSNDTSNCAVSSSSVIVSSINSGTDSIVITLDNSADPSVTLTSCKYGTVNGEYTMDGTIEGNTCTLAPTQAGIRYYYELTFSDGSKRSGSVQGGAGTIVPSNTTGGGTSTGGNGSGSGNGGSGSNNGGSGSGGSSSGGGIAAPVLTEANGRTVYDGRMVSPVQYKYFNVTTGTKCDVVDFTANGGNTSDVMSSGCLKFWAYMEDDLSYTMILDREYTTTEYQWASNQNNGLGPVTALAALKEATDSWQGTITPKNYTYVYMSNGSESAYRIPYDTDGYKARLITTDEIKRITGNTAFNPVSTGSSGWFYLDGGTSTSTGQTWQTQIATASQKSAYVWLYNYMYNCVDYGCNTNYGRKYGHWTSDAVAGTSNSAWVVSHKGALLTDYTYYDYKGGRVDTYYNGIRPVITVLKSVVD